MGNLGGGEILVVLLLALLVLGPDKLPGAARQVGKAVGDLRRITNGFQSEIRRAMDVDDRPVTAAVLPDGSPVPSDEAVASIPDPSVPAAPEAPKVITLETRPRPAAPDPSAADVAAAVPPSEAPIDPAVDPTGDATDDPAPLDLLDGTTPPSPAS